MHWLIIIFIFVILQALASGEVNYYGQPIAIVLAGRKIEKFLLCFLLSSHEQK